VHARRLLAALGQPHKIYDSEPCALSKEPAAEEGANPVLQKNATPNHGKNKSIATPSLIRAARPL
jgi:hypothetical protein